MDAPASPSHLPPQHATFNTAWTLDSPSRIFAHPLPKQRAWERQPRPTRGRTVWKRYETRGTADADRTEVPQDEAQTPEGKVVKRVRVQRDGPATALGRSGSARAAVVERRGSLLPHKLPNSGGLDVEGVMPADAEGEKEQIIVASASASEWRPRHWENPITSGYRASATRAVADRQSRGKSKRRRQTDFLPSTNCVGSVTKRRRASAGPTSLLREGPALSAIGPSVPSEIALEDSQESGTEILEEEARLEHVEVLEEEAAAEEQVSPLLVSEDAAVDEERRVVTEALKKPSESSGRRKTTFPALLAPQSEITKRRASVALDNLEGVSTVAEATQHQVAVDDPSIEPTTAVEQENEGSASKSEKAKVGFSAKERKVPRRQTSANLAERERVTMRDTRRVSAALETLREQDRPVVATEDTLPPPIEKPTGDIKARSNFEAQDRTISRRQTSATSATVKSQTYTSECGRRASVALETICEHEQRHASVMDLSSAIEEKQEVTEPSDTQFDREGRLAAESQVQIDGTFDDENTLEVVKDDSLDAFEAVDTPEAPAEISNDIDQVSERTAADCANTDAEAAEAKPITAEKPQGKPKRSYRRRTVEDNVNAQAPRRTRRATAALEALQRGAEDSGLKSMQKEHAFVTSPVIEALQIHDADHSQVDTVATHVDDESVSEEQAEAGFAVEMSITISNVEDAIPTTVLHDSAGDDRDMTDSATAEEAQEVAANMFDGAQDHQDSPEIVTETVIEMQDFTSGNIEEIQDDVTSHVLLEHIPSPTAETEELDTEIIASPDAANSGLHDAVPTPEEAENPSVDVEEGTTSIAIPDMEQTRYRLSEEKITDMMMFTTTDDLDGNMAPNDEISTSPAMEDLTEMMDLAPEPETTETVTTVKVQLNDDDTDMLKDFMSRARASKAAKIAKRSSLLSRQDSNIVKAALSSPRKALENLDSNSPLPREQEVLSPPAGADSVESRPRIRDLESATNDELGDEDELAMAGPEPEAEGNSRRSSRILKSHSRSFSATPSSIAIRRPAGEADAVAFKKSEAQQTALITRTNTRRNKGGSVSARVMLMRMKGIPTDEAAGELEDSPGGVPGLSRVKWNEELVAYFEEKEKDQVPGLGEENKTETLEGAKTDIAMSKPRAKRSKMLGAANGTPAKPKYKDLEMSVVTPSTAPTPSSALTKSAHEEPSTVTDTPTEPSVSAPQPSSGEIPNKQPAASLPPPPLPPPAKEAPSTSTAKPARRIPTPARTKKSISTALAAEAPRVVPAPVPVRAPAKTAALKVPTRVTRRFANAEKDKENEDVTLALVETKEDKTGGGKGVGRSVLPRRGVGVRR